MKKFIFCFKWSIHENNKPAIFRMRDFTSFHEAVIYSVGEVNRLNGHCSEQYGYNSYRISSISEVR